MKRKSQIEIMGLLIIVMMVSLLLIFALRSWLSPAENPSERQRMRDIAASFVGAMLNTNSGCMDDTLFSKVLIDCARKPGTGTNGFVCTNGKHSCDFAHDALADMFNKTIDVWKYPYDFKVVAPNNQKINKLSFSSANVGDTKSNVIVFIQPLPLDTSGFRTMQIFLCVGGKCPI